MAMMRFPGESSHTEGRTQEQDLRIPAIRHQREEHLPRSSDPKQAAGEPGERGVTENQPVHDRVQNSDLRSASMALALLRAFIWCIGRVQCCVCVPL